jgi:transaldolase
MDGLRGVTSNPSIFEKAIDSGTDYDARASELVTRNPRITAREIYDELVIEDVHSAADARKVKILERAESMGDVPTRRTAPRKTLHVNCGPSNVVLIPFWNAFPG